MSYLVNFSFFDLLNIVFVQVLNKLSYDISCNNNPGEISSRTYDR